MRVLISGGGTAGHINPALAIAGYFQKYHNAEILFIGTQKGLESTLVPKAGFAMKTVVVEGLIRSLTPKNIAVVYHFLQAVSDCKKIIRTFSPDLVIGTGGYVCAPVMFAAHRMHIPTVIHEQNVIPGVTIKMAARFADVLAVSFADTSKYFKPAIAEKCVLTGNPLRENMLEISYEEARARLGLDSRPFIVSLGGSLGARALNRAAADFVNDTDTGEFQFLAGCGKRYYEETLAMVKQEKLSEQIRFVPYIYNMEEVLPAADLVIARAGALTVSELTALGRPAILIPSPNVAHNHQEMNARSLEKNGAARVILERELTSERLKQEIADLIFDEKKRSTMSERSKQLGILDGTKRICDAAMALLA